MSFRIATLLSFLLLTALGCGSGAKQAPLVVEDFAFQRINQGERIVSGVLHNPTERAFDGVLIVVTLRDAENLPAAEMHVTVNGIAPGERKKFRQVVDSRKEVFAASYKQILEL